MPTVLITGANRGIGLEFVRSFAADGWRAHACCRQPDKATELKNLVKASAGLVVTHRLDATDGRKVESLARELADEPIDALINNAGVLGPTAGFGETDYDEWLAVLKINTLAPLRMAECFAEHVARSGRKLIVNISSRMGSIAETTAGGDYIYRSSKAALDMVSKGLANDLRARGITVIVLSPGWVRTDMGGPRAPVTPHDSVTGMRAVLDRVTPADSGKFFGHTGQAIPW